MKSKEVTENEMLLKIVEQMSTKIAIGQSAAYDLWYENYSKMKFSEYAKNANEAEQFLEGMTAKEREDEFWANMSKRANTAQPKFIPEYAIDNELSLFPDCYTYWNLSKFTGSESIIHMVCILQYFTTFY